MKPTWRLVWRFAWRLAALGAVAVLALGAWLLHAAWRPLGKMATGARLERMQRSAHFVDGRFVDLMPRVEPKILEILPRWLEARAPYRRPVVPMSHKKLSRSDFAEPPATDLRITWLGHSTTLLEIGGKRVLIDPVWGEYVAPLELENARRFIPPPLPFEDLPALDAVVISHDHYDHLDMPTIERLARTGVRFFVPLGVGSHLEYWGVPRDHIVEHEWWDETRLDERLTVVCTPARHFSGRSLVDRDKTLWAGWAFISPGARVYFSGDTALFPGLREIGDKYGPFDATLMESGAYNQLWADVHLGPEQAVLAHEMLRGKVLIPVHWAMFDLGLHGWTEPIERILIAADKKNIPVATLRPGDSIEPAVPPKRVRWWPERPFETAEQAPVRSSGLD